MRAVVRRHRLAAGDRLVFSTAEGEAVTAPIVAVGESTVALATGEILPAPPGVAVYIERDNDEEALLAKAVAASGQVRAD